MAQATVDEKRDRRKFLALMGAGGAAAAAALLSQRNEAEAHGTVHYDSASKNPAVHGNNSSTGAGVLGTANGPGVRGIGKPGMHGISTTGAGVRGEGIGGSDSTIGVYAKNLAAKRALRTRGKVQMDCVRIRTLSGKKNTVPLPSGTIAGPNAVVIATAQGNPGNDAAISRAFRLDAHHIRIVFNKKPLNPVKVGYWVAHRG